MISSVAKSSITYSRLVFHSLRLINRDLHRLQKSTPAIANVCYRFSTQNHKQNNNSNANGKHKPLSIVQKLDAYSRMCRYDKPIGAMLLYWPTAWGVVIGAIGLPSLYLLALFFVGSWTSRSAGCIVNDYLDRDFDGKVQRTKSRPLASGEISIREASMLLLLNLTGGLFVLFYLPESALYFTFGIVALAAVYPLAKRYTSYPQFILGVGFNSGIVIAALTANPEVSLSMCFLYYIAGISWTMVYDTVYAYQDIDDDLKIGIKSTAIEWKDKNPIKIMERWIYLIMVCHASLPIFIGSWAPSLLLLTCDLGLLRVIRKLDLQNKQECGRFFRLNNYYGFSVFLAILIGNWYRKEPCN